MHLTIKEISKTYRSGVKALNSVNLTISKGMLGILGPNGAGKSTLMRILTTFQKPDKGTVHFNELDIFRNQTKYRQSLGYLPQEFGVYKGESAHSLLSYLAVLKGLHSQAQRNYKIDEVLELTNLTEASHLNVSEYSGGMKQRFGIAQLLLNDPKVIIVDEPTAGLDPEERTRFQNILKNISHENIVLFSTHLVDDVLNLCNEFIIINKGNLHTKAKPQEAINQLANKVWEIEEQNLNNLANKEYVLLNAYYGSDNKKIARIYSDEPLPSEANTVSPTLHDFYFFSLNQSK